MSTLLSIAEFVVLVQAIIGSIWLTCLLLNATVDAVLTTLEIKSAFLDFIWEREKKKREQNERYTGTNERD